MNTFKDKIVWITGASSGFGEALAYAFASKGAKLILSARRADILHIIKSKIKNCEILPLDLEEKETFTEKTKEAISLFGSVDIIVHNAGIAQRSNAIDTQTEVERKIMEVDYFSYTELTRCILPYFLTQKKGHIVVVSGLLADIHLPGRSSYAAAKSALLGYFGCLRAELTSSNIDVTVLIPGSLRTDLVNKALDKNGNVVTNNTEKVGCSLDKAASQAIKSIYEKKYQTYIGEKDKAFIMWKVSKWFPNFAVKKLLKPFQ